MIAQNIIAARITKKADDSHVISFKMIFFKKYLQILKILHIILVTEPTTPLNDADHGGTFF